MRDFTFKAIIAVIGFVGGLILPASLSPIGEILRGSLWGDTEHITSIGECQTLNEKPAGCKDKKNSALQIPKTFELPSGTYHSCKDGEGTAFNYTFKKGNVTGLSIVQNANLGKLQKSGKPYCTELPSGDIFCSSLLADNFEINGLSEVTTTSTYPAKLSLYRYGFLTNFDFWKESLIKEGCERAASAG